MEKAKTSDNEVSVEDRLRALYSLQLVDSQIDKIKTLRGELPLEVQDLEDAVEGLETRLSNYKEEVSVLEHDIQTKSHEILESEALIKKYEEQQKNVQAKKQKSIDAMLALKEQAFHMKEVLLKGDLDAIGQILDEGWKHKKQMADSISNAFIDEVYEAAITAGATGGKISGAGGGGFMFFYCPSNARYKVIDRLAEFGGQSKRYEFVTEGLKTWTMNDETMRR